MNVHVKQLTQADRIHAYAEAHPSHVPAEIAEALGVRPEYVRAVTSRRRRLTNEGRLENALAIAQKTYRESLELRRLTEISPHDADVYRRYCRAWELHQAAEKVYLMLNRELGTSSTAPKPLGTIPELDPHTRPIKGVNVRTYMEQNHGWVPLMGTAE